MWKHYTKSNIISIASTASTITATATSITITMLLRSTSISAPYERWKAEGKGGRETSKQQKEEKVQKG